jgi:hypothetical protein
MVKKNSNRLMLIVITLFLCITFKAFSQSGDKPVAPTPKDTKKTSRLQIKVTTGNPPKNVEGAAVTVESEEDSARYMKDVKTNKEGIVSLDHVPQGKVRILVVAKEHETFGERHTLTKDNEIIKITLKRSGDQNNP